MTRWIITVVAGVVLGLATHIATLLAIPTLAPNPAFHRVADLGPPNVFVALGRDGAAPRLPFLDPALRYRVCRFDLSDGPLHIRTPVGSTYLALSFYAPSGVPFFAINDRSATAGILGIVLTSRSAALAGDAGDEGEAVVTAPVDRGLVLLAALVPAASEAASVEAMLAHAQCDAAAPVPQTRPAPVPIMPPLPRVRR